MAEIRKHSPATGSIGDLVRAALGGGPRPVETGSPAESAAATPRLVWTDVKLSDLPVVPKKRADPDNEDDEDA